MRIIISSMLLLLIFLTPINYFPQQSNRSGGNSGGNFTPEAIAERYFTGQTAGDYFGNSISNAGDVNGDGYDDIIIGAYYADAGGSQAGSVFIFYGGKLINTIPDVIINGSTNYELGKSVSGAGDVNADGYDDVIVGSWKYNSFQGRVDIYFGGSSMDNTEDVSIAGEGASQYFGNSVSCAGDVNGDGYDDVIVGAYGYNSSTGRSYIYYGGSSMNDTVDKTLNGENTGDAFGISVSGAGDVNGDGYDDVIVGAYCYNTSTGRSYIYYGGSTMDETVDLTMTGEGADNYFGMSVSDVDDANGDGYDDFLVGAHGNSASKAYLFNGGPSIDNTADVIFNAQALTDNFGTSVCGCGDFNGDGYADILVGANSNDENGTDAGRAYLFWGGSTVDAIPDNIFTGAAAGDWLGISVSTAGDMNGDGYTDIIIAASKNDTNGSGAGRVYLYTNSLSGTDMPDEFFTGEAALDYFGYSVASAGDVNGDGYDDIIIGARENDAFGSDVGRAYIFLGGTASNNEADIILTGETSIDVFGSSVSSAGDVNADGYDDVLVGAYGYDNGSSNVGRAYIFLGGATMNDGADIIFTGEASEDYFGISVSSAGDVNSDGYSDVMIGSSNNDAGGIDRGRAYIYYGGSSMNNGADVTLSGEADSDFFGYSVASAGDVNGDGFDDVVVGAAWNAAGGTQRGKVYVYYGGNSMNNSADITLSGEADSDNFGFSVASAGDVNNDNYGDIIIGALYNDDSGTNAGKAYIYFGNWSMDTVPDIELTGESAGDEFACIVSCAGDVNNDNYSDVLIGARGNNAVGIDGGRAYVYFGGNSMNNIPDIVMTGITAGDSFGQSINCAGDINNDSFSEIIIGAPMNDAGGTDAGRSYLYLSSAPPTVPRLASVRDVPNDQGGYVKVRWTRSGYDIPNINRLDHYIVQRSDPPGKGSYVWETITTIEPTYENSYIYTASTWSDSTTNSSGTIYFRIRAQGTDPDEIWTSNIVSGHSVDNLAPESPKGAVASRSGSDVILTWDENTESDLKQYLIYRNSSTPLPEDAIPIATTTDLTYTDTSPLEEMVYYFIKAEDIHSNKSDAAETNLDVYLGANVKVFLQGCYSSGSMLTTLLSSGYIPLSQPYNTSPWNYTGTESVVSIPSGVVDWVLVELRSDETTIAGKRAGFLKSDGTITDTDDSSQLKFSGLNSGSYYVVIRHRNHLAIMTANKVTLTNNSSQYNFSSAQTQAYGTNAMKDLGSGVYGLYTGDSNKDGQITALDFNTWNANTKAGQVGYVADDMNLDGQVTVLDFNPWNANTKLGATTKVP
ncbi:MAG: integrin alpha [bacterium]